MLTAQLTKKLEFKNGVQYYLAFSESVIFKQLLKRAR